MDKALVDLHIHSTCSDGIHSPTEVVRMAEEMGLAGLALTDHDTIKGINEFLTAECSENFVRVPGVEISSDHRGIEVHMLGYFVPTDNSKLNDKLKDIEKTRRTRFPRMIVKLRDIGIDFTDQEIAQVLRGVQSPGRPHVARLLIRKGIVKDFREAFQRFLVPGKPGYIEKDRMEATNAISLLREVSAAPVMAHPLVTKTESLREFLVEFKEAGLVGVETYYDYSQIAYTTAPTVLEHAMEGLDLIRTGGSDYHGDSDYDTLGRVAVPLAVVDELREAAESDTN